LSDATGAKGARALRRRPPAKPARSRRPPTPFHHEPKQVAGVVGLICLGLYPAVVVPLQIAYAGREHPAQRRMREEAAARAEQEQQAGTAASAAASAAADDANNLPPKAQAGFGKKSMWASINQAAKAARS